MIDDVTRDMYKNWEELIDNYGEEWDEEDLEAMLDEERLAKYDEWDEEMGRDSFD